MDVVGLTDALDDVKFTFWHLWKQTRPLLSDDYIQALDAEPKSVVKLFRYGSMFTLPKTRSKK